MSTSWYMRIDLPFSGTPEEARTALDVALVDVGWTADGRGRHISLSDDVPVRTTGDEIGLPDHGPEACCAHGRIRAELWMENLGRAVETLDVDGVETPDPRARIAVVFDKLSMITTALPGDVVGGMGNEHDEGDRGPVVMTTKGLRYAYSDGDLDVANQGWFGHVNDPFPPISRIPVELIDDHDDEWRRCSIDLDGLRLMLAGEGLAYLRHLADRSERTRP